ncbi:hypothetical protein PIB30_016144 [Stylosanthes scabra]|uniref:Uncharacterized protein n=1 Tax=Stylosanthes scabra TaxID=79078 RepID=A0ABU6S8K5_9FABA|nr:hypothetical protein [Stylosanthes scabra]
MGFPQHSKEHFEVKLYAPNLMARQFGFAQATPAPLSLLENEQVHRLKIDSIDGLIADVASNEDRRKQYSPFECEPCTMVTRAFNNWWNAYYKRFIKSFDQIKARADALLGMDQPICEKKQAKRKADPSDTSKKTTKKPKGDKASTSTKISKAKTSVIPPAPTVPTLQVTNPEPSAVRSDASSGTKISEGEQLLPKEDISKKKKARQTPLRTESDSSDSGSTPSKIISPVPHPQNSPIIESNKSDGGSARKTKEAIPPDSSSDTSIQVDSQLDSEKNKNVSSPPSPQHSNDLLLDLTNLVAELHKAASDTVFDKAVQSDSINRSIQQVIQSETNKVDTADHGPNNERPDTPPSKCGMSKEVVDALCWLINLLNAQVEDNVDNEEVKRRVKVAASHFHSYGAPEEAALIEAVPLLVKNLLNTYSNGQKCQNRAVDLGKDLKILDKSTADYSQVKTDLGTKIDVAVGKAKLEEELRAIQKRIDDVEEQKKKLEGPLNRSKQGLLKIDNKLTAIANQRKETEEQLAAIKREEKDERALYEKFLENQGTTRQALEDILTEYNN